MTSQVPARDFVEKARTREGRAKYVFGAEATGDDPRALDCSEDVEWSAREVGVEPRVPDGAFNQWRHCTPVSVEEGIATLGALLFVGDGTGSGRDAITHVAISLGNGFTTEARGSSWGVGTWPAEGRFDFAGLIPGIDYSPVEDDDMTDEDRKKLDKVLDLLAGFQTVLQDNVFGLGAKLDKLADRLEAAIKNRK